MTKLKLKSKGKNVNKTVILTEGSRCIIGSVAGKYV